MIVNGVAIMEGALMGCAAMRMGGPLLGCNVYCFCLGFECGYSELPELMIRSHIAYSLVTLSVTGLSRLKCNVKVSMQYHTDHLFLVSFLCSAPLSVNTPLELDLYQDWSQYYAKDFTLKPVAMP